MTAEVPWAVCTSLGEKTRGADSGGERGANRAEEGMQMEPTEKVDETRAPRRRGCMLGLAIGDALGAPVEFRRRRDILSRYGPDGIKDLQAWRGQPAGTYTDDTQMSVATARGILDWREATGWGPGLADTPDLDALALAIWERYGEWSRSPECPLGSPGSTCLGSIGAGVPLTLSHPVNRQGKGCGGVMRVAPLGLAGLGDTAFEAAARAATLTHRHPTSDTSSGFLAALVQRLVDGASLAEAIDAARDRLMQSDGHEETLDVVDTAVCLAGGKTNDYPAIGHIGHVGVEAEDAHGKGWVAEEALGIALFCALRHQDDFPAALRAAANISGDSDSTASITGAIVGAARGEGAIPRHWVDTVQNRELLVDLADRLGEPRPAAGDA